MGSAVTITPDSPPVTITPDQAPQQSWWQRLFSPRAVPKASNAEIAASPVPGSFEGHPENIGEYVPASAGQIYSGAKDIAAGNFAKGGHEVLSGAGNAALPVLPFAAAAAPVAVARTALGGAAGAGIAKAGAKAVGATPDQEDLATDIGGVVGGGIANKLPGAVPSAQRASAALEDVKANAGSIPINTGKAGDTALEIYEQSQRGAVLPKAVRQFVMRATDPNGEPITYAEAKDFQSNISKLSANEKMSMNANTKRLVGQLNADLKGTLEDAADTAGKGEQFVNAMKEYHHAMQIKGVSEEAKDLLWKTAFSAAGLYGARKIWEAATQ